MKKTIYMLTPVITSRSFPFRFQLNQLTESIYNHSHFFKSVRTYIFTIVFVKANCLCANVSVGDMITSAAFEQSQIVFQVLDCYLFTQ